MAKPYNDKKLKLGDPLATKVRDFCAANYGAPVMELIREALNEHIDRRLQNREMRERYERARKERLGLKEPVVQLVPTKNGS